MSVIGLMVLAFGLRLANVGWQLPHHLHPDEPPHVEGAITQAAHRNFENDYNNQPPLFRDLLTFELLGLERTGLLGGSLEDASDPLTWGSEDASRVMERSYVLGRVTSALFGGATVLLLFSAARALLGFAPALFSALCLALSLTHVRESHFATTTATALFFSALSLLYSSRYVTRGGWKRLSAACLAAGLAVATRDLMLVTALFPTLAFLIRAPKSRNPKSWLRTLVLSAALVMFGVVAFILVTPYQQSVDWQHGMESVLPKLALEIPSPQHAAEVASFYIRGLAQSYGVPMLAFAIYGVIRMAIHRRPALLLHGIFPVVVFGVLLINRSVATRFSIPLELFISVCSGYGIAGVIGILQRANVPKPALVLTACAPFVSLFINAGVLTWIMGQKDTRVLAFDWVQSSLEPSSIVYVPPFSLPGARADDSSNTRVPLVAVPSDEISTAITGDGCGEYVAVSSFGFDLSNGSRARPYTPLPNPIRNGGSLVARFSPTLGPDIQPGPDEEFAPFWNLYQLQRPGPIVEIYAMTPPCSERRPQQPLTDLVALNDSARSAGLSSLTDPRFGPQAGAQAARLDGLPRDIRSMALGRFIPGDEGPALAVLFRDQDDDLLGIYRVAPDHPPQLVQLERDLVACNCSSGQGLATLPSRQFGLDELAILGVEEGVERIDIISFGAPAAVRTQRWSLASSSSIAASGLTTVPPDASGPGGLALIYVLGSQYRVQILNLDTNNSASPPSPGPEFRLPNGNRDLLPIFAVGDFDGNGRNELALADTSRKSVRIFRMPPTQPGNTGTLSYLQQRASPEGTKFLQPRSPDTLTTRQSMPPELVALDWVGTDLQLLELSLDMTSRYPLHIESAPGIVIPDRSSVIGLAEGRFLKQDPFPSIAIMTQDGRAVTLELYRRDRNGQLMEKSTVLDRWRTEPDDRPLRNSLAAVDLDGDGVDELANGRVTGSPEVFKEFHFHSLTVTPKPAATLERIDREIVPAGAEFTAISRLSGAGGNLALAYRVADQDTVAFINVPRNGPASVTRTCSWASDTGRLSGLAALPGESNAPAFAILERGLTGQNLVRAVASPGGGLMATQSFAWPSLRGRAIWVSARP